MAKLIKPVNGWHIAEEKSISSATTSRTCYLVVNNDGMIAQALRTEADATQWAQQNDPKDFRPGAGTFQIS